MSTQPYPSTDAVPPSQIEDKPPAGTPCLPCKRAGHWCPAEKYIGQTDDGTCNDCAAQRMCPIMARRQEKQFDVFEVPTESTPPQVNTFSAREKQEAERNERAKKALAGEFGQDAMKIPKAKMPIIPVPAVMAKYTEKPKVKRPQGRPGNPLDLNLARAMRLEGKSFKDIARKMNVGVTRVTRELGHATPKRPLVNVVANTKHAFEAVSPLSDSAYRSARIIHGKAAAKERKVEVTVEEKRAAVAILDHPKEETSQVISSIREPVPAIAPVEQASRDPFDEVIAHLEREMAETQKLLDGLKARRK